MKNLIILLIIVNILLMTNIAFAETDQEKIARLETTLSNAVINLQKLKTELTTQYNMANGLYNLVLNNIDEQINAIKKSR